MGEVVQPCPPRKESGSVEVKPPKFSRLLSASVAACPRLFQLSGPGFAIVAAGQEGRGLALSLERFIADPRDALAKGGQVDGLAAESVHAHLTLACLSQGDGFTALPACEHQDRRKAGDHFHRSAMRTHRGARHRASVLLVCGSSAGVPCGPRPRIRCKRCRPDPRRERQPNNHIAPDRRNRRVGSPSQ
jgi:hypothetical protein